MKYAIAYTIGLCNGCISLSNAEGLIPAEKVVHHSYERDSLVSARKGKNKGKYIRVEFVTAEKSRGFKVSI